MPMKVELRSLKNNELKEKLQILHLPITGNKEALIKQILGNVQDSSNTIKQSLSSE
ncbi:hypothetical protein HK096_010444, partial [Nowakowskiella sp. JEL0078]